jgi:hypothetical protein
VGGFLLTKHGAFALGCGTIRWMVAPGQVKGRVEQPSPGFLMYRKNHNYLISYDFFPKEKNHVDKVYKI